MKCSAAVPQTRWRQKAAQTIAFIALSVVSLTLITTAMPQQAAASERYEVIISNDGVETNAQDFFAYSELLPGDVRRGSAVIVNATSKRQDVNFFARLTSNEDVSERLMATALLTVENAGTPIYEGPLEGAGAPAGGVKLSTLTPEESSEIAWALSIPEDVDNKTASAYGEVEWGWTATEAAPLAHAGDDAAAGILAAAIVCALAIIGILAGICGRKTHAASCNKRKDTSL